MLSPARPAKKDRHSGNETFTPGVSSSLVGHATSAGELGKFAAGGRKKFASDQEGGTQPHDADNMASA